MKFDVWAPHAHDTKIVVDGVEHQMRRDDHRRGWWISDVEKVPGQRYGFSLFDGDAWSAPLPDPRSTRQPDGVHGLSEVTDDEFEWSDQHWTNYELKGQVIYELHVGTFTEEGTFDGVVDKLDYLVDLGVTTIELMPVQPFGGERNWGYDGVDWFAVQESYGGPGGLKRLVNAAHNKGVGVYLDVVYNHFGPDGNYNGQFGPYTTAGTTGWGDVVNFSGSDSDEVRAYVLDAVRRWLDEFHIDGLRLDAVHSYDDREAYSIMEQINMVADEVEAANGPNPIIIAESDLNDPRIISDYSVGGYGLDAQWLDDVHHALHTVITGENNAYYEDFGTVEILADTLRHGFRFRNDYSSFRGRTHGRALDLTAIPPWKLITYTTTHDQVGNRAQGDRPSQNLTPAQHALKAAVIFFSPFTPMIFMGEESFAQTPFPFFVSHTDEELMRLTREGRAHEFARYGWDFAEVPDPADPATFQSAKLDWNHGDEAQSMYGTYKTLLTLRRELDLAREDLRELQVEHSGDWLTMGYDDVVLAANFSGDPVTVPVGGELVYSFTSPTVTATETRLDPWGFAVIERRP
ncbi:malto-oligosyltrehalose trehalohydrolase [Corynebacterium sp. p3-SID1145]|uniref:malto-oligosyltrehalose trehalohydrolase n=1 Tax=unclassified Corynebacterium TaxID=2624378 RepID=UPI0021A98432|nr:MULTISPECIES: malto-oligosyltrehalose trehalohydrolase [unclassified Corynebacterium]MCT1451467.1 malto-oligosyltrehalose trehalohydrolase [Corynebacterium sp. p3-SID1145]MCT1460526.1 malto-oligosyltrehalose trehalohydrolase [Corynebacterium sp. p3-SID1140]